MRRLWTILWFWMLSIVAGGALWAQSGSGFYVEPGGTMTVENNIILYNTGQNINVSVSSHNAVSNATNILENIETDFRLKAYSPAANAGNNLYVTWLRDFMDTLRIINEVVDLGAFEYPVWARAKQYAVHQVGSSGLTFCNNIIVNNPEHYATTNATSVPDHNILSDSIPVLKDAAIDFSLTAVSPAVDAGQNSCNALTADLQDGSRVFNNTIDIGAYEYAVPQTYTDTAYTVWQNDLGSLTFCNNIDINNCVWSLNTNITNLSSNIVTDNDSLFMDNVDDYMPRPESEAVDAGNGECSNVQKDLADNQRIMGGQIDIGAYEQYVENEDSIGVTYAVHQVSGHTLLLCNNVIVNNPEHHDVTNVVQVPDNNILSDSIPVFSDAVLNFKPYYSSPAVDAGDNSCNGLAKDIDTVGRISGAAIDIGAFELPVRNDSIYTGGGGGGAGGEGGSGGAFYHTTVHQHSGDSLVLCNNIIINNCWLISNAYEDADTVCNILTDSDSLFTDNRDDYMPRPESPAVNTGCNSCNAVEKDLSKKDRIYQEIIDIGAFEQYAPEDTTAHHNIVVHQVGGGTLLFCNNVIVNNLAMESATNIEDIPDNNILSDSIPIFCDAVNNFALWSHSPAVDAGSNSCCELLKDLKDDSRISNDTIDIGAFEFRQPHVVTDTTFAVFQHEGESLTLCNNIVINNTPFIPNTNIEIIPDNNIVEDNDSIFTDNRTDFMPLPQSIAVNQGDNLCNSVAVDLAKHTRIMADTIDIGAFEQFVEIIDTFFAAAVTGDTTHHLQLYNNIIINNPGHTENVNGNVTGDHNLTQDVLDVFADASGNFNLMLQSPAIDAGDNQRIALSFDIKDDPRVACGNIVDQGAFEFKFSDEGISVMASEIPTDNCQGYYIQLTATAGAQHYYWSHTNEDTNVVMVSPLIPTEYTVITSNGGECLDTASVYVIPSSMMSDTLGSPASIGTTFWLSYLRNHFQEPTLSLQVSAEEACTGTVSNPQTGWSSSFEVAAHSVTAISIPVAAAYPTASNQVDDFGLLVQTTDSVSLYAANYNTSSFDVTNVLPMDALSDEYVLQTYTPMMNAEFVVVATVDNTVVDITPSRALQGGHAAQQTFSVILQAGQTYMGMSQYGGILGDLSGTVIQSHDNKPVAVFNGNVCALVPSDNSYTDHLVEQAVGVNYWGRSFALTSTESQNFDVVRVTASRNNTEIRKNGVLMTTLQAYQTHEFQLNGAEGSCFIETSEPAGVYLYIAGAVQGNAEERSDPSMIWIPPTEQKLNDLTFATFNSPGITDHYVNIVIPASSINEVTLDGVSIGSQFALLAGNENFAFARKHIANGTHTLHCDGGFIAHCYGLGYHESYGYAAGSKAVPLKEQLFVNGILNTELPADMKFCPYEPITFAVELNYPCDSVVWNLGDGSPTVNGYSTEHAYSDPGNYSVSATLYVNSNGTVFCSNLYARIRVVPGPMLTFYDTVCQGDNYTSNGFDVEASESGHFTYTRAVSVPGQYCDSTFVLELEVRDNHLMVEDTICLGNSYQAYGFNFTPIETGLYTDTANAGMAADGCDSLVILQLMVTPNTDTPPEIDGELYPCQGGSYVYTIDSLSGLTNVVWTVPDSILVLQQPDPYQIELLFATYADSFDLSIHATGGCGDLNWSKTVYPQAYSFVQLTDTICEYETEYEGFGFSLTDVSDTNSLFIHHGVAAGGCDSTTVLRLVFAPPYQVFDTLTACSNDFPYLYHDTLLADTGTYAIVLSSIHGCDSTVNLTVTAIQADLTTIDTTVCDSMIWYGLTYTESGIYDTVFTNMNGCDSVVRILLTVHHSDIVSLDSVVCHNELPMVWNGVTFLDAGTDTVVLSTAHDCDSIVVMNVIVHEMTYDTVTAATLENNLPYTLNDSLYYSAGTFTQILTNTAGCDSILTIILTVLNNETSFVDTAVCEDELSFVWNDSTYNEPGTYTQTLLAANGADSTVYLSLTIKPLTDSTLDITILENELPYLLNDSSFTAEGTYIQHFTNAAGCDSILTVNLTVIHNVTAEVNSVVCEGELPIWWNDSLFTEAGTKVTTIPASTGADSTITMTLIVSPTTYSFVTVTACDSFTWIDSVTYTQTPDVAPTHTLSNAAGCDSVVTLYLTINQSVATEDYVTICENELPFTYGDTVFDIGTPESSIFHLPFSTINGCDSIVTLYLTINPLPNLFHTPDTTIIACSSATLWASGADYLYWMDSNDSVLSSGNTLTISPLTSTTYYLGGQNIDNTTDSNLVVNGDFEQGNVNFTSDYQYLTSQYMSYGHYTVTTDGYLHFLGTHLYGYNGSGQFLLVDGATTPNTVVWQQTVPVTPNTYYAFSAQVASAHHSNSSNSYALLQFCVNSIQLGDIFHSPDVLNVWQPYYEVWYSGDNTSATLSILNQNTTLNGNDFGVDHISFSALTECTVIDSIVVTVLHQSDTSHVAEIACDNYIWFGDTLTQSGEYLHTLTNASGCDSLVLLNLTVNHSDTTFLTVSSCDNYIWYGDTLTQSGSYTHTLSNAAGCDSIITLLLTINSTPVLSLTPDTLMDEGDTIILHVSGADHYLWYPAEGLSDFYSDSPLASPSQSMYYHVIGYGLQSEENNLVVNGDFELGNTAFTTDYNYVATPNQGSLGFGNYVITPDAYNVWPMQHQFAYNGEGQFLVVDGANYPNAVVWSQTVEVDPNTIYDFSTHVVSLNTSNISAARLQFFVNGIQLGPVFNAPGTLYQWQEFHDYWNSGDNVSATITIVNQNTNGQGNDFGLDHILFFPLEGCQTEDSVLVSVRHHLDSTVCEDDMPIEWNGLMFYEAGEQQVALEPVTGLDSILVMHLTVNSLTDSMLNVSVTQNMLPFDLNGYSYDTSGVYTQTLVNAAGCDSTLTIHLTVFPNTTSQIDSTVCESELPIIWNDSVFTAAGTKVTTLLASSGADSTVVMTLTVIPTTNSTVDTNIVENLLPFSYNDSSYYAGGSYTQHLTNAAGCDSILTLHLTVYPNVTEETDSTICESELPFTWNDSVFTAAGTKTTILLASTGADSTVVMNLHVTPMPEITHSPDTVILAGETVTLWGSGANIMTWTDANGNILGSGNTLTVNPSSTTYYYLSGFNVNDSSVLTTVINGDFELGNTGFNSDYIYSTGLGPEGRYCIGADAHSYHSGFTGAHDHTTGSGKYMIVNGAGTPNTTVWEQTVNVEPHTNYAFSTWVCTVSPYEAAYLARLQFSINGIQVGEVFQSPLSLNTWSQFYQVWNSGTNTQADIVILNQNTVLVGNDFGIDDIHFSPMTTCSTTDSVLVIVGQQVDSVVCDDDLPVEWNGHTFTEAGTAWAIIPGTDSAVLMNLVVHHATDSILNVSVLENALPYSINDSNYTISGTYTQTLTNSAGCDSVLTIHLTVIPNVTTEVDSAICENDLPFTWNGVTFDTAGTQSTVLSSSTGADSTIVMTVVVNYPSDSTLQITVLENDLPFTLNDSAYDSAGVYTQHLTNAAGCDSILTIELSVLYNVASQTDSTLCANELPLTWNGVTFTQADTLTAILPAANGADSVVTMVLNVKPLSDSTLNVSVIQNNLPYTLNGISYSAGGIYTQTFTNTVDCDSIVTLNLTVYYNVTTQVDTTVCAANLPFSWHGHSFTAAGTHTVTLLTSHGADSVVTYHLAVDNITATVGNITHITCHGESTGAATATVTGGQAPLTYVWTNATGTSVSTSTSISNRPAGTYTFTVTDHIGCSATATATINTLNGPLTPGTIAADQVVCDGEDIATFTGTAASGGDNGAYQWQISTNGTDWSPAPGTNNAQTYTYPDPAANNFTLRRAWVSQSCGTAYSNTVTVEVAPNSSDTISAEVCLGETYQENGFDITADQTMEAGEFTFEQHYATGHCDSAVILLLTVWPQYETELEDVVCEGDGYSNNGFEVSPLETVGTEVLQRTQTLQSVHGCDSVVLLTLTVIDTSVRIVPLTADFCDNMSMELMVETGMSNYEWSTGETAPTITVTASGYYSVTATEGGCTSSAGYRVEGCQFELVLPNAITPSDFDGVNDYFALPEFFLRDISLFEIAIFNRWGEMVYYSTDKGFKWNGEYRGEIQYQTIYNYVIKYTDSAGRPFRRTGSITVL